MLFKLIVIPFRKNEDLVTCRQFLRNNRYGNDEESSSVCD